MDHPKTDIPSKPCYKQVPLVGTQKRKCECAFYWGPPSWKRLVQCEIFPKFQSEIKTWRNPPHPTPEKLMFLRRRWYSYAATAARPGNFQPGILRTLENIPTWLNKSELISNCWTVTTKVFIAPGNDGSIGQNHSKWNRNCWGAQAK